MEVVPRRGETDGSLSRDPSCPETGAASRSSHATTAVAASGATRWRAGVVWDFTLPLPGTDTGGTGATDRPCDRSSRSRRRWGGRSVGCNGTCVPRRYRPCGARLAGPPIAGAGAHVVTGRRACPAPCRPGLSRPGSRSATEPQLAPGAAIRHTSRDDADHDRRLADADAPAAPPRGGRGPRRLIDRAVETGPRTRVPGPQSSRDCGSSVLREASGSRRTRPTAATARWRRRRSPPTTGPAHRSSASTRRRPSMSDQPQLPPRDPRHPRRAEPRSRDERAGGPDLRDDARTSSTTPTTPPGSSRCRSSGTSTPGS